jgi:hypothetical protein
MKCLNPECESLSADEVNVSYNVSYTANGKPEPEYLGDTYMGDCSALIGTTCPDCNREVLLPNAVSVILNHLVHEFSDSKTHRITYAPH